jgi:hypothetical protein
MVYHEICDDVMNHLDEGFVVQDITASLDIPNTSLFNKLNKLMGLKKKLLQRYSKGIYLNYETDTEQYIFIPTCVLQDSIYNLVVRDKLWDNFDLSYICTSLKILKLSLLNKLKEDPDLGLRIFMPIICIGVSWSKIYNLLYEIFKDIDIEIVVCYDKTEKHLLEV